MSVKGAIGLLGLTLASTLAALALAEMLVRFVFPPVPATIDARVIATGAYEAHPVLGWRPRPNLSMRQPRFDVTFTTNSRGLRGREHNLQKAEGSKRIVVLGDSFAWGYGVSDDDLFSRVLESKLERTEVINLGVTAYGLRQEIDYLKLEGALYGPDIVILAFCQNDVYRGANSLQEQFRNFQKPITRRVAPGAFGQIKSILSDHLALYRLTQQAINARRPLVKALVTLGLKDGLAGFDQLSNNLMPALHVYPPKLQRSMAATEAELLELRDWLTERGIRFVIALIPALEAIDARAFHAGIAHSVYEPSDFDLEKPYRDLEAFARRNSIEIVNAYPAFKRRSAGNESLYLPNDFHFNAAGHDVFAAEIAAHLLRPEQTR